MRANSAFVLLLFLWAVSNLVNANQDKPQSYQQAVSALINETAIVDVFLSGAKVADVAKGLKTKNKAQDIIHLSNEINTVNKIGLNAYIKRMYKYADRDLKYLDSIKEVEKLDDHEATYRVILIHMAIWGKILDDYDAGQSMRASISKYDINLRTSVEVIYKFKAISEEIALFRLRLELEDLIRLLGRELHKDPDYIWKRL